MVRVERGGDHGRAAQFHEHTDAIAVAPEQARINHVLVESGLLAGIVDKPLHDGGHGRAADVDRAGPVMNASVRCVGRVESQGRDLAAACRRAPIACRLHKVLREERSRR
jgi:hypothetical protein